MSKRYEHTSVVITTNLNVSEWGTVFGDAKMATALLERLTHHCHIVGPATRATASRRPRRPRASASRPGSRGRNKGDEAG
jgi:DNA replication protein DnaC